MDTLRWLRVIGDTIFAIGVLALGYFVVGLKTGWSLKDERIAGIVEARKKTA
jgi:nitric oxide reductase subunit B